MSPPLLLLPPEVTPPSSVINLITGATGALVVLVIIAWLFLIGELHTKHELRREEQRANDWKQLYEDERDAHRKTRDALVVSNERTESAVETARVTRQLLEETRAGSRRRGHAEES